MIVKTEKNIANLSFTVGDNNKGYVKNYALEGIRQKIKMTKFQYYLGRRNIKYKL